MKAVILAAGYATRLYPLTLDRPKPLLEVAGRPILEHVLDRLETIPELDRALVVTNAKFAGQFEEWARGRQGRLAVEIVNDGSTSEADKLGAIGDLAFTLEARGLDDDLVVVAGDNLFDSPLDGFVRVGRERGTPVLAVHDVGDTEALRHYNTVVTDGEGRITFFEEKPADPTGTLAGIALYFYPRSTLPLILTYLEEGNNPDQPGRLIQWLYPRTTVHTWQIPGLWFDIGSTDGLAEADSAFAARKGA